MTVPKSKRRETKIEFVHNARVIEDFCIRHWDERFSSILQRCIQLSAEIYDAVSQANSIYPTNQGEYKQRTIYLKRALSTAYALKGQISLAYRHQKISTAVLLDINEYIEKQKRLLKGVIKKDKERYSGLSL
jgi:hypothetical protein